MANVSVHTITSWYTVAKGEHGESAGLDRMAIGLLEEIANQEEKYARRNERNVTEAEEAIARIAGEG